MSASVRRRPLLVLILAAAVFLGGCGDDGDQMDDLGQQAEEAAQEVQSAAEDAFATLRTDGERLIDTIQARNDPAAKDQLLDRCRDALEKMRQADSQRADEVDELCTRIRDTDVNNRDAWNGLKEQLRRIS